MRKIKALKRHGIAVLSLRALSLAFQHLFFSDGRICSPQIIKATLEMVLEFQKRGT